MGQTEHILVVDDHLEIRDLLGRYLSKYGYRVSLAENGEAMRRVLGKETIDLVVLDLMMPGEDGLTLCRELQGSETPPPIIMLTAMGEETDRIVGLEMGADDYVTKPFSPRELMARIKAVLRRSRHAVAAPEASSGRIMFDRWVFNRDQHQLEDESGVVIPLSTAEFRLLDVLVEHPRRVLTRDQLIDLTKGKDALPFDRSIDNQVSRLRKKVEQDPKQPTLIKTIWGGGYMFAADIKTEGHRS
ncbi:response regulator [Spongorhabdus nitratireducens]